MAGLHLEEAGDGPSAKRVTGEAFLLQRKTEVKDICFGRPVHAIERLHRDARGGADVDDRACATLDQGRSGSVGEASESALRQSCP